MLQTRSKPTKKPSPRRAKANGQPETLDVMTLDEAAAYLRVSADAVVHMIEAGGLPGRQFGTEWRFFKGALQEWLSCPPKRGILWHVGKIKDDPYADEMLRDIYARRRRPEAEED